MTEPAPLLLPSCLPLSTPLPPPCLNIPCGAAPAIWEVVLGEAPWDICLPVRGLRGEGWAWHSGWGQGTWQPLPPGPAVSFLHPAMVLAAGWDRLGGLGSWQGARPRRVELSQKCSSGRALSRLDKRGTLPSGARRWARWQTVGQQSGRDLGGGLKNEGVPLSLLPSS